MNQEQATKKKAIVVVSFGTSYPETLKFPSLSRIIDKLKQKQVKKVILMPFLLVTGDHATNDMAGEEEDSAKSQLLAAGFEVDVYFRGLGENTAIQDIYVAHLKAAIVHPTHGHGHAH